MPSLRQSIIRVVPLLLLVVLALPASVLAKHDKAGQPPSYGPPAHAGPKGQQQPPYGPPSYAGPKHKGSQPPGNGAVPPGQAKKVNKTPKRHGPPSHAPAWGERAKQN